MTAPRSPCVLPGLLAATLACAAQDGAHEHATDGSTGETAGSPSTVTTAGGADAASTAVDVSGDDASSEASDDGACVEACACEAECVDGVVHVRGSTDAHGCVEDGCVASIEIACPGACAPGSIAPAQRCAVADAVLDDDDLSAVCAPTVCADPVGDGDVLYDQHYGPDDRQVFDAYLPDAPADAPRPVFVWIHGGAWLGGGKGDIPGPIRDLRRQGVVVLSLEYRLSDTPFPTTISDVRAAIRWIRQHGDELALDPHRIAVSGDSAGGHLATMLGVAADVDGLDLEPSDDEPRVALVVDVYGPTELLAMDDDAADNGCGPGAAYHDAHGSPEAELVDCPGDLPSCVATATLASPLTHVDADDPPFVILHGGSDCTVPTPQGRRLHDHLMAAGVPSQYAETPGAGHDFDQVVTDTDLAMIRDAIDAHLFHCERP